MMKLKYLLFTIICLFSCNIVLANNEITIKSVTPIYDEESSVLISNEDNNYQVTFDDKNQSVKYNVVIENTTDKELKINKVDLTESSTDFLVYRLEGLSKSDILKAKETKELILHVETAEEVYTTKDISEEISAIIDFEENIINPFTSTKELVIILLIVSIITGSTIILYKRNKYAKYLALVIVTVSTIPMVKAENKISLQIKVTVNYETNLDDWNDDGTLKILSIGNSFSVDSLEYVYQIAENLGVEKIKLGNLYIGGCSLSTHLSNAKNDKAAYTYYTNDSGTWTSKSSYKISTAVQSEDWDFITFQQASQNSGQADTYNDLNALIDIVEPMSKDALLVWHMTWAYQGNSTHSGFANYNKDQLTMYNAIVGATQTKIDTNDRIEFVIPVGTSVQNTRTSSIGDTLTRDGYHLSKDLGRYIGSLTFVSKLTNLDISKVSYSPAGVSTEEKNIAIKSVLNAIKNPYQITNYSEDAEEEKTEEETQESDERRISITWTKSAYYQSTSTTVNPPELVTSTNSTVNNLAYFWATQVFTRETLPVGSVIEIASGWQYRPEGWSYDSNNNYIGNTSSTRPANVTTNRIVIDNNWWSNYEYRGFNISSTKDNTNITSYTEEQMNSIFKVYLPEETTDLENEYELATLTLYKSSYYYSSTTEEDKIPPVLITSATNSKYYWATQVFTKETLPVGSIIEIASGWQYRPEGWSYDSNGNYVGNTSTTRPPNITTTKIVVDEDWWGSYSHRGFNIAKEGNKTSLATTSEETIRSVFKIYIPKK